MRTASDAEEMQSVAREARAAGQRIGLVPTMGFLHEGHLSLVRLARQECDLLVVSLFVNPIQFGAGEDLAEYPRDLARDTALCEQEGVDILFCPDRGAMYGDRHSVYVEETELSTGLCGASRSVHFRGVTTVVAKLFNIVAPDVAVFGRKDAQQARVIEKMATDLNFPVRIVAAPIVREPDGLAMSSRNTYLTPSQRRQASIIFESLCLAEDFVKRGERNTSVIVQGVREKLESAEGVRVEYVEAVDDRDLQPVKRVREPTLLAVAVRIGDTRLIDNALLNPCE